MIGHEDVPPLCAPVRDARHERHLPLVGRATVQPHDQATVGVVTPGTGARERRHRRAGDLDQLRARPARAVVPLSDGPTATTVRCQVVVSYTTTCVGVRAPLAQRRPAVRRPTTAARARRARSRSLHGARSATSTTHSRPNPRSLRVNANRRAIGRPRVRTLTRSPRRAGVLERLGDRRASPPPTRSANHRRRAHEIERAVGHHARLLHRSQRRQIDLVDRRHRTGRGVAPGCDPTACRERSTPASAPTPSASTNGSKQKSALPSSMRRVEPSARSRSVHLREVHRRTRLQRPSGVATGAADATLGSRRRSAVLPATRRAVATTGRRRRRRTPPTVRRR